MYSPAPFSPVPATLPVVTLPYNFWHAPLGIPIASIGFNKTSGAYTTANTAVAYPFWVYEPCTVYKIGWHNGSSAGGNTDVGIYDASWNLLVSTGSTLRTGNSLAQWVDTTNTNLSPNVTYYIAINHSQTNANNVNGYPAAANTTNHLTLCGVKEMAVGATALPATFTPATPTAARMIPTVLLAFNSVVA